MKDELSGVDRVILQRKICKVDVEVPTIIVEPFLRGGKPRIFVQWFADFFPTPSMKQESWDALVKKFEKMQFQFPVLMPLDDKCWMGHPELFKVVSLGQVQDWHNKAAILQLGRSDDWILWLVSSHYGIRTSSGEGPASFIIPLKVMSGNKTFGLIIPQKYCDTTVIDREREAFERQGHPWVSRGLKSLNG